MKKTSFLGKLFGGGEASLDEALSATAAPGGKPVLVDIYSPL